MVLKTDGFMLDVSVVIVNFNTSALTARCIESILASKPLCSFEIIVVDNASTDQSQDILTHQFPNVIWVQQPQNHGYATGLNAGVSQAKGTHLVLMNSDAWIVDNVLDSFMLSMAGCEEIEDLFAPVLRSKDGSFQKNTYAYNASFREVLSYNILVNYVFPLPVSSEVKALNGACLLISAHAYRAHGGFDESFFLYSEEFEFCHRVLKNGGKLKVLEKVTVYHENEASSLGKAWNLSQRLASIGLLFLKTKGVFGLLIFMLLHFLNILTNVLFLWKMSTDYRRDYWLGVRRTLSLFGDFINLLLRRQAKPFKI